MDVQRQGSDKPSKVEAIKLASQYLKTFVADEVEQRPDALHRGRGDRPQVPRLVPAGRPRRPDPDEAEGKEKAYSVHGAGPDRRRQADRRPVPGLRPSWPRRVGNGTLRITTRQEFQLHGVLKDDLESDDPRDQRDACSRRWRPAATSSATSSAAPRRSRDGVRDAMQADADALGLALRPAVVELLGHLARRREDREPAPAPAGPDRRSRPPATTRSSRSTARRTCRASSRRPSPCPKTTAPTSMPTTWAILAVVEDGELVGYNVLVGGGLGTTPSAAEDVPVPGACRSATSTAADVLAIGEAVHQGLPRLRQPLRPQARPAQVHHPRLGHAGLPGQGRGVPRPPAGRPEAGHGHRRRRPPRLARAGRRQALPGHPGRERPDQGRGRRSAC